MQAIQSCLDQKLAQSRVTHKATNVNVGYVTSNSGNGRKAIALVNRPSDRRGTEKKLDTAICVRNVDHQSVCNSG